MAYEKGIQGTTVIREKWMRDDYGVIAFDNGKAMIVKMEMFDDIAVVRALIEARRDEHTAAATAYTDLASN